MNREATKSKRKEEYTIMQARILGIADIDFTSQEGAHIVGKKLFVCYQPETSENIDGLKVNSFFVRSTVELPDDLAPNLDVNLYFTEKGKIEAVVK